MADNVTLSIGTEDGAVIATDDITSVHYQIVRLAFGALGTSTLVHGSEGLPVAQEGTWTVDLGTTDNGVLDAIAASVAAIDTDATTIIGHVDGIETLLGTIDTDTSGIITAVQLIDNAVYVDDADWTDDTSSHFLVGGLYQSTPQTVTDGDVAPFNITANGALHVSDAGGSLTVDNAGLTELAAAINSDRVDVNIAADAAGLATDAKLDTIIGHVDGLESVLGTIDADTGGILIAAQLLDNAVYVDDADWSDSTSSHFLVGGLYQSAPQTVTDGDVAPFNITVNGALHTAVQASALPTGAATAANQTTIIGHVDGIETLIGTTNSTLTTIDGRVDGIEALLGTIDADTGSILTSVQLIDNLVPSGAGSAQPNVDSFTQASFNLAAGADQVLVASAASKQVWVYGIGFTTNVAGTVSFQDQDNTAITGVMNIAANSGMAIPPSGNFAQPLWKLGTDKDFEVDVVTAELDGWVTYAIVSV